MLIVIAIKLAIILGIPIMTSITEPHASCPIGLKRATIIVLTLTRKIIPATPSRRPAKRNLHNG